eukprot:01324_2
MVLHHLLNCRISNRTWRPSRKSLTMKTLSSGRDTPTTARCTAFTTRYQLWKQHTPWTKPRCARTSLSSLQTTSILTKALKP